MNRNFGLDIMRALAITLVIVQHAWYFELHPGWDINPFDSFGFLGVELFFVLSGFLIGQIAIKTFFARSFRENILKFYLRRWLRTLPLYYILLIGVILSTNFIYKTFELHPLHFLFLQNFDKNEISFYGASWSLAVEEWFYLLLPVFFGIVSLKVKQKKSLILAILGAIAVIGVIRLLLASSADMDFGVVRKFIPLRFDSLMIGVLLASFKLCYGGIYNKLAQKRVFLASLSGLTGVIILHGFFNLGAGLSSSFFLKTYGLTLLSVFTAGLIPYLEASKFINIKIGANKLLLTAITTLSIISYPIYLTHMEIFVLFTKFMSGRMPTVIVAVLAIGITIVFALLLNKLIEQPIMNFRDRLSASRKSKVSEPGASFARLKKVTALSTA